MSYMNRIYCGLIFTKVLKVVFSGSMIMIDCFFLILTAFPDFCTINTSFVQKKIKNMPKLGLFISAN